MGQLDLETHTDGIIPLFAGNVQDKSTEKTGQKKNQNLVNTLRYRLVWWILMSPNQFRHNWTVTASNFS